MNEMKDRKFVMNIIEWYSFGPRKRVQMINTKKQSANGVSFNCYLVSRMGSVMEH